MIISRTPFRISFFGGGTDFPEFYKKHGGTVLLTTINHYCYISVHRISQFFKYRQRASYARTELVQEPSQFKHPLIRESLLYLKLRDGIEITHVSDLPGRTGLGTSSAFTVGLLNALHHCLGQRATAEDLAQESILIERERVGDAGGHQDQYAAAYGGFLRLDFTPERVNVKRIPLTAQRLRELEKRLLLFYTGVERSASQIQANQRRRVPQNTPALMEMRKMADAAEKVVSSSGSLHAFGDLLHESWLLKRGLTRGITTRVVDEAYEAACRAGAVGGKLLGAGGRGFLLLYAEPDRQAAIRRKLAKLMEVEFSFSSNGSEIIFSNPGP